MTEPTDDEIVALAVAEGVRVKTGTGAIHLVRAALRSWGQPSGTGEPVGTIKSWTNGSYCRNYKVEWHRNDLPEGAQLYTTQQPTQPQAMPDLSQLTERGAKAWAGVDAQALREGGAGVSKEREDLTAFYAWLRTYEDEVGALDDDSARVGFIAGRASLSANAGEPMFWVRLCGDGLYEGPIHNDRIEEVRKQSGVWSLLHLAAPPAAQAQGWQSIETAPKDGTRILLYPAIEVADDWSKGHWSAQNECWIVGGSPSGVLHTAWHPLPPPPTSAEGVEHG